MLRPRSAADIAPLEVRDDIHLIRQDRVPIHQHRYGGLTRDPDDSVAPAALLGNTNGDVRQFHVGELLPNHSAVRAGFKLVERKHDPSPRGFCYAARIPSVRPAGGGGTPPGVLHTEEAAKTRESTTVVDPLKGTEVTLAPLTDDDLPTIAGWREDGLYLRLLDAAPAYPGTLERLRAQLLGGDRDTSFPFAVRTAGEGRLVGFAVLDGILWSQGNAWLTIAIGDAGDRGKGYGRDAVSLLLAFGFGELNLRRVTLTVFSYNTPAMHLYETLGFVREGSFRSFLLRDGQTYDMHLYGMLRSEWEARRPPRG
jgi:RimJ/RimL family protein N-acetyltransferase